MAITSIQSLQQRIGVTADERERIVLLRELSAMLHPNDMPGALRAIKEALRLARAIRDETDIVCCMISVGECYRNQGEYDRAWRYLSRAGVLLERMPEDGSLRLRLCMALGLFHRNRSEHADALCFFNRALAISEESGERGLTADVRMYMSYTFMMVGENRKAAELLAKALATYEELGDREGEAIVLNTLGDVCKELSDWEQALHYYRKALHIARETGHRLGEAITMNNIADVHLQRGELDEVPGLIAGALALFQELKARQYMAGALYRLGGYHMAKREYGDAMRYLRESLESAEAIGSELQVSLTLCGIADVHINTGDAGMALSCLDRAIEVATSIDALRVVRDICITYVQLYELTEEPALALRYYKLVVRLSGEVQSREATAAMAAMELRVHNERLEKDRETYRLKAVELEREMEQSRWELITMAMRLVQSNEFLGRLKGQILPFVRGRGDHHALAKTVLAQIEQGLHQKDAWQAFEQRFQHVHQGFVGKLSELCPRLTPTELKVCSLLKIGLSSKEIAAILNIGFRTVELHRTSIRKKMGLPGSTSLSVYLASL